MSPTRRSTVGGMAKPPSNGMNPFVGQKGFWARVNRIAYTFTGPAAVGIGRPEEPYVAPADPTCPLCGSLMAEHEIERGSGTTSTRLHCPSRAS